MGLYYSAEKQVICLKGQDGALEYIAALAAMFHARYHAAAETAPYVNQLGSKRLFLHMYDGAFCTNNPPINLTMKLYTFSLSCRHILIIPQKNACHTLRIDH